MGATVARWYGHKVKADVRASAEEGLFRASELVLEKANETVPIEEGLLKASGDTDIDGQGLVASIFYNTPYAAAQHEEVTYQHKEGRRAKWLQLTMQEQQQNIKDILADALRGAFKGRFG